MKRFLSLLLLMSGVACAGGGCASGAGRSEARLERQLERLGRELEDVMESSELSTAERDRRLRRLESEFQRTLKALGRHLQEMAGEEAAGSPSLQK